MDIKWFHKNVTVADSGQKTFHIMDMYYLPLAIFRFGCHSVFEIKKSIICLLYIVLIYVIIKISRHRPSPSISLYSNSNTNCQLRIGIFTTVITYATISIGIQLQFSNLESIYSVFESMCNAYQYLMKSFIFQPF